MARGTLSLKDPVDEPQALYVGQTETITEILAEFDTRLGFASAGKLSAQNTSATDYANSIYHTLAVDGKNNKQQLYKNYSFIEVLLDCFLIFIRFFHSQRINNSKFEEF